MLFSVLCVILALSSGGQADRCGDRRKMNCKEDCPETNGKRWDTLWKTNKGCCAPGFMNCFGNMRTCELRCDKCSCPSGYKVRNSDEDTIHRSGSTARTEQCCQQKCNANHCTGSDWKLKSRTTFCDGHICPINTSTCCVYTGSTFDLQSDTIEVVKSGDCESRGFEYIKDKNSCEVAAAILGINPAGTPTGENIFAFAATLIASGSDGGDRQKYCGTWNGMRTWTFNSQASGSIGGKKVLQHAGRDNFGKRDTYQICKGTITDQFRCGTQSCAYYYVGISGTQVSSLLNSNQFRYDDVEVMEPLTEGLQTKLDWRDEYGVFVEAWVNAPYTAYYRFMVAADDGSVVYASLTPNTKNGEFATVFERSSHTDDEGVLGTVEVYWEAGRSYYVYGYMKEHDGGDKFRIGYKNNRGTWEVIPQTVLAGAGCAYIDVQNLEIKSFKIDETELENQIREQTVIGADNCKSTGSSNVQIEQGAKTTITTHHETTIEDTWANTFGWTVKGEMSTTVKWKTGWLLSKIGGASGEVSVTASAERATETTEGWNNITTTGSSTVEETYNSMTYTWTQEGESKSDVIITGNKYKFTVKWQADAVCRSGNGDQVGPIKQIKGTYKSFGYTDISYNKEDGICALDKYCQPDIQSVVSALHMEHATEAVKGNLLADPIESACDAIDCTEMPIQCRDNQDDQASWVFSKWFIEKCNGAFDPSNPCVCEFPIFVGDDNRRVPTAGLTVADTNACTYGLPGSYGYSSIAEAHKVPHPVSTMALMMSNEKKEFDVGRRLEEAERL